MEKSLENEAMDNIIFNRCHDINELISKGEEVDARNNLVRLLDYFDKNNISYNELVNHLIRKLGLYPYLKIDSSSWQERYIYNAFKVDVGLSFPSHYIVNNHYFLKNLLTVKAWL